MNNNTQRIAKNTLLLYFRQILIMLTSLYTVRVVLNVLGAEDYGTYNVTAGVVTMFGFLSVVMAAASQRYFSFDLGKNDIEHLKTTFSVTFEIYLLLVIIIIVLAETLGLWFINNKLVIPPERIIAVNWIYQAAILSFLFTLITTPYMACIIAHENMNVYAYVSIIEVLLKLGIVFVLKIIPFDKLIVYGILLAVVSFINTTIYRVYCRFHYEECKIKFVRDKILFKEIISYSGWNLFGSIAAVFKTQVMNILLNQFYGVLINAARSIAASVNSAVTSFSSNFSQALNPQIVKSYASGNKDYMQSLAFRGCKLVFFLMFIFILPLYLEMDTILQLWLKNPPEYAALFTRLALLDPLSEAMTMPLITMIEATGNIKLYKSLSGIILLLNLPISWLFLHNGANAEVVMIIAICLTFLVACVRLVISSLYLNFSIFTFLHNVVLRCVFVTGISVSLSYLIHQIVSKNTLLSFLSIFLIVMITMICILLFGFNKTDKKYVVYFFKEKFKGGKK